jgi:hypothetical protein
METNIQGVYLAVVEPSVEKFEDITFDELAVAFDFLALKN